MGLQQTMKTPKIIFQPFKHHGIRACKSHRSYSRALDSECHWCCTEAVLGWGDKAEQPCEALSVHEALSILLSFRVQKCELKWSHKTSKKHGIKLFHLNYSTPVYRALTPAELGKSKNKMVCTLQMVSVLAYCRSLGVKYTAFGLCFRQSKQSSSGNSLTSDQEGLTAVWARQPKMLSANNDLSLRGNV